MRPSIKESAASLNFAAADLTTKYSAITFEFTTSRRARSSRSPAKVDSGINVIQSELRTRSSSRLNAVTFIIWLIETRPRSEEHTSELQSLMRISYAVFCLKKNTDNESIINTPKKH